MLFDCPTIWNWAVKSQAEVYGNKKVMPDYYMCNIKDKHRMGWSYRIICCHAHRCPVENGCCAKDVPTYTNCCRLRLKLPLLKM